MPGHAFLFFSPSFEAGAAFAELTADEHHHLSRVLRLKRGDLVHVTNGRGAMAAAVVAEVGRDATHVRVTGGVAVRERSGRLVLAMALIARDRFEQAFEQCVELGITECVPVVTEHCRLRSVSRTLRSRLERIAISAMKQSGRAVRVPIGDPTPLAAILDHAREFDQALVGAQEAAGGYGPESGDTLVLVGPEAGFTDGEVAAIRAAGVKERALSLHRLRSATAAVALVSSVTAPAD